MPTAASSPAAGASAATDVNRTYNISMYYTPAEGVALVADCLPAIEPALADGIDFANHLQPDPLGRDQYFWSHSARYRARQVLSGASGGDWCVIEDIPNSGIHLSIGGLTVMRVLRSVHGTTPPPGTNRQRRLAWSERRFPSRVMEQPDTLILDWSADDEDSLVIGLGLPAGLWKYWNPPQLAWRVQLPSHDDLAGLSFVPDQQADELVRIRIHETEMDVG